MGACPACRLRLVYSKTGPAVLLGHLDLVRHLELVLRRAGGRLAQSAGYRPRPRLFLPAPLPLGMPGLEEVADVLVESLPEADLAAALNSVSVEGLCFLGGGPVPDDVPRASRLQEADYLLQLAGGAGVFETVAASQGEIPHMLLLEMPDVSGLPCPGLWAAPGGAPCVFLRCRWKLAGAPRIDRFLQGRFPGVPVLAAARERFPGGGCAPRQ